MRTAACLLFALILLFPAAAGAQKRGQQDDAAPWFSKDCLSPCAQFKPQPCPDINDDVCFNKMIKQQHKQDQCIRACEKSFWGSYNGAGYGQFKLR